MSLETIAVGNLTIQATFVDHFEVDIYSDAAYSNLIETQVTPAVSDGAGNWNQKDLIAFTGLTAGQAYYLQAGAVSPGAAVQFTRYSVNTPAPPAPGATYAGVFTATPAGVTYDISPSNIPIDIDHFEAIWTKDGSVPNNSDVTSFFSGLPLANGFLHIFAGGSVGQTIYFYLRAVTVLGVIQNWVEVDVRAITTASTSGATYADGTSIDALRPAQVGADVTSANGTVLIQNPNFIAGNVGWTTGNGVTITSGSGYTGSTYTLNSNAAGTISIINKQPIPCAPGAVISASCYIDPGSSAVGTATARINFFNVGGASVGYTDGNQIPATTSGTWQASRVVATAPAGTSFAKVCAVVYNNTSGSFAFGGFGASILANSLDEVPDGNTYSRPVSTRISAGRPIIDFNEPIHFNQTMDHMPDGSARFGAVQAGADKTSSNVAADTSKVNGVASSSISPISTLMPAQAGADKTSSNTANDTANVNGVASATVSGGAARANAAIDSAGIIYATSIDFSRSYVNKTLDNINDGGSFARPVSTRINAGRPTIDFSESIHANQTMDHMADGTTRFGAVQAGADKTSSNTAADTSKVNGVAAASISPIAGLMPAQAGADVTSQHIAAGFTGQGSLATLNSVGTSNITAGSVNSSISVSTNVAAGGNPTATLTISGTAILVSVRAYVQMSTSDDGGASGYITLYKGTSSGTVIATTQPQSLGSAMCGPIVAEAIDTSPATNQVYTVVGSTDGASVIHLVADCRKV